MEKKMSVRKNVKVLKENTPRLFPKTLNSLHIKALWRYKEKSKDGSGSGVCCSSNGGG
jgi:hypothetical protein